MTGTESSAAETTAERVTAPARRRGGPLGLFAGLWRRLWANDADAAARAAIVPLSDRQLADLRRAFAVRELAGSALLSTGRTEIMATTLPALVGLAREAAFWSLAASLPEPAPADAAEALGRTSPSCWLR